MTYYYQFDTSTWATKEVAEAEVLEAFKDRPEPNMSLEYIQLHPGRCIDLPGVSYYCLPYPRMASEGYPV